MMVTSTTAVDLGGVSGALLIARLFLGLPMAAHGTQKLLGWFGGYGLTGTGGYFETLGFRPGRVFAAAAALSETTGGLLLVLGLLGPLASTLIIAPMVVAMWTVHRPNGFFAANNGIEVPFLYTTGAVTLAFAGPGLFSLDALLGLTGLASPALGVLAVAAGVLGGLGALLLRHPAAQPAEAHS